MTINIIRKWNLYIQKIVTTHVNIGLTFTGIEIRVSLKQMEGLISTFDLFSFRSVIQDANCQTLTQPHILIHECLLTPTIVFNFQNDKTMTSNSN